jgi:hypothetical protein
MSTGPVLTVERRPVTAELARYPLATRTGIAMLGHLIEGDRVWSGCTKPQRAILDALCRPVIEWLIERGQLDAADLPELPERTTTQTRAALLRRGLVADGRITGRAVYAWYWAVGFKERPKPDAPQSLVDGGRHDRTLRTGRSGPRPRARRVR